jgi:hypothetical protein
MYYSGSKFFWKIKCNVDINIVIHVPHNCYEIIIYNIEDQIELSRLYLDSLKVKSLVGTDDIQHCVNVKKENYYRQKKILTDQVLFQEAFRDLICNIIVGRATVTEIDGTKTYNLPSDATHCVLLEKPRNVEPFKYKRQAKVTLADFESSMDQFKEETLKLKGASYLASRSAGLSKLAINAFKSTVSVKASDHVNATRKRWIKAINQILVKNYLAKVKIILNTKYTQFGRYDDEDNDVNVDNTENNNLLNNEKQGNGVVATDTTDDDTTKVTLPKLGANNLKQTTTNLFANNPTKAQNKINPEKMLNRQSSAVFEKASVSIPKINKTASMGIINISNDEDSRTGNESIVKEKIFESIDIKGNDKKTKKPKRVLTTAIVVNNSSNILADGTYVNQSPGAVAMLNAVTSITSIENDLMVNKLKDEKLQHEILIEEMQEKNKEIIFLKNALGDQKKELDALHNSLNTIKCSRKMIFYNNLEASRYNENVKSDLLNEINATKSLLKQQQASHQVQLLKQADEITRLKKENILLSSSKSKVEHHRKLLLKQVFITVSNLMDEKSELLARIKDLEIGKMRKESFNLDNDKIKIISSVVLSQLNQNNVDLMRNKSDTTSSPTNITKEQIDNIIHKLDEIKNVNVLCSDIKQSFDRCINEISLITNKEKKKKYHGRNSTAVETSANLRFRHTSKSVQEMLNSVDAKFSTTVDDQLDYYQKSMNSMLKNYATQAETKSEFLDEDTSIPWNS